LWLLQQHFEFAVQQLSSLRQSVGEEMRNSDHQMSAQLKQLPIHRLTFLSVR
jgi:hypothetical protein